MFPMLSIVMSLECVMLTSDGIEAAVSRNGSQVAISNIAIFAKCHSKDPTHGIKKAFQDLLRMLLLGLRPLL